LLVTKVSGQPIGTLFKGEFIGFKFKGQAVQVVESLTEKDRRVKFFSVENFQSIGVEQ
jgi:hypothetical protein